ncbi:MAG: DUF2252 domain-containing protein [Solirubrobacteraceae bacterium]
MARTTPDPQAAPDTDATEPTAVDLSPVVESTADAGRHERARLPRRVLGQHQPAADRPDPIAILEAQGTTRVQELLPIRYGRMAVSPFTFYRGAAAVMSADLGAAPQTTLRAQLCGDAHLSNFGIYRSPERSLVFDLNDFDETLPGPFEWDTKRLAASFIVAGRSLGWTRSYSHRALLYAMGAYRLRMGEYARSGALETWYSRITIDDLVAILPREAAGIERMRRLAAKRDNLGALNKLTTVVDGRRQLKSLPPLLVRLPVDDQQELMHSRFRQYRRSLAPERRVLIDRYRFVDIAHKVVGVGSVGTRCWVVYFEGPDGDPLFLQAKEATASVLEPYLGRPAQKHHGQRVVLGQKLMQAASDVFLGWMTGPLGPHYYWRQLWDAKISADLETMRPSGLLAYARVCGWALARAHARSGNPAAIAAYMGTNGRFERAMLDFSEAYADQTDRDYAALRAAIDSGRIEASTGI